MLSAQAAVGIGGRGGRIEDRSDVIRYIQAYDDNGYRIRRIFDRDNRGNSGGTPIRDDNGRPRRIDFYDTVGEPHSLCGWL